MQQVKLLINGLIDSSALKVSQCAMWMSSGWQVNSWCTLSSKRTIQNRATSRVCDIEPEWIQCMSRMLPFSVKININLDKF